MNEIVNRELQINIHPNDHKHFEPLLRHQLNVFGGQVDRVRLTLDLHNSESGRYRSEDFEGKLRHMRSIIRRVSKDFKFITLDEVDTSEDVRKEIAQKFFCRDDVPIKAWDGGPFYSYLYGIWKCRARTIIHIDSDMMFGGMSQSWIEQAENILDADSNVIFVAPLAGPPHPDGLLKEGSLQNGIQVTPYIFPYSFVFSSVSTRIFVTRPQLINLRIGYLDFIRPSHMQRIKAFLLGNPSQSREFEVVLSKTMQNRGLRRVDLLGVDKGMWSIHPPYRSDSFFSTLPSIINKIEIGNIPVEQLGHYDLQDCMCDWTVPRKYNRRSARMCRQTFRVIARAYSNLTLLVKSIINNDSN